MGGGDFRGYLPYGLASLFPPGTLGSSVDLEKKGYLSSASGGNERHSFEGAASWHVAPFIEEEMRHVMIVIAVSGTDNVSERLESFMTPLKTYLFCFPAVITFAKWCNFHLVSCFLP